MANENKIATEGDVLSKFGIVMTSYTTRCVKYRDLSYYGLTTSTPYGNNQLVKLNDICKLDPILTLYVSLQDVIDYYGDYEEMPYMSLMLRDGSQLLSSSYNFTVSLVHNNYPNCYISGKLSSWQLFYDDYAWDENRICLQEPMGNNMCSGYLTSNEWDVIYDMIAHETDGNISWPSGDNIPFSISRTTWFPSSSASSTTVTVSAPGNIYTCYDSTSWISVSKSGSTVTVSVTANTSTARTGYVYFDVAGQTLTLTVTQSAGISYTIPISYCTFGWNRGTSTASLNVTLNGKTYGGTATTIGTATIKDGPSYNGVGNTARSITTLTLSSISGVSLRFWGANNGSENGKVYVVKESSSGTRSIVAQATLDVWGGDYNTPTLSVPLSNHVNGDSYEVWFEQGTQINGDIVDQSIFIGSTAPGMRTENIHGSWVYTSSPASPYSGYHTYQSNGSYNVNNGYDVMRIWFSGYKGTLTLYLRSNAETNYDYAMISQIDQVMSASRASSSSTYSNTELIKAHTRGKQNSGTTASAYTTVSYTVPDNGSHFIDVVYRKDGSQHAGTDRGYVLLPYENMA